MHYFKEWTPGQFSTIFLSKRWENSELECFLVAACLQVSSRAHLSTQVRTTTGSPRGHSRVNLLGGKSQKEQHHHLTLTFISAGVTFQKHRFYIKGVIPSFLSPCGRTPRRRRWWIASSGEGRASFSINIKRLVPNDLLTRRNSPVEPLLVTNW